MASVTQAAVDVLVQNGGRLMHYRDLADAILARNDIESTSADPLNAIHSTLWHHVKKQGADSWLIHRPGGFFGLSECGRRSGGTYPPTWLQAAYIILRDADKPLHADEIYERAIAQNLKADNGRKWKGRAISNILGHAIRTAARQNADCAFERVSPAVYTARI